MRFLSFPRSHDSSVQHLMLSVCCCCLAGSQFAGASRRVRRLVARGILQRVQLKPGIIIRPRDHWPRPDGRAAHCRWGTTVRHTECEHRYPQAL